jgi:hypothetical protein
MFSEDVVSGNGTVIDAPASRLARAGRLPTTR